MSAHAHTQKCLREKQRGRLIEMKRKEKWCGGVIYPDMQRGTETLGSQRQRNKPQGEIKQKKRDRQHNNKSRKIEQLLGPRGAEFPPVGALEGASRVCVAVVYFPVFVSWCLWGPF